LNGILWVLRTGAPWADLLIFREHTHRFRPATGAFSNGCESGIMSGILERLTEDLRIQGRLDV
jgi:transposase